MERWGGHHRRGRETVNPSFSSSLLDAIYRSIDEEADDMGTCSRKADMGQQRKGGGGEAERGGPTNYSHLRDHYKAVTTTAEKCYYSTTITEKNRKSTATVTEKVVLRRRGYGADMAPEYLRHGYTNHMQQQQQRERYVLNSTSSSSDSSYGGFSSSEAESVFLSGRPKPVMISPPSLPRHQERPLSSLETKKESSIRSRIRASKFYTELKKAKSPVSTGGRLAAFLNTLFTSPGHPKKPKTASSSSSLVAAVTTPPLAAGEDSACSSASSYSRSCLSKSKTPSSRGKPADGAKRSVRFYPVSVIVDDNLRPCGHKILYRDYDCGGVPDLSRPLAAVKVREREPRTGGEGKRADEAARDLIIKRRYGGLGMKDDEDEDDDAASYSSSDLFELENLTANGGGAAYGDELPVYETTHLHTNRAIAQGLIV